MSEHLEPIRIFIGFDPAETAAYNVLCHSINKFATKPIAITPIALKHLGGVFNRERNSLQSTEFSFSRFLAPYLAGYKGWSVFMDNDMMFRDDIAKLFEERDENYAVQVVKHDHKPTTSQKFLDMPQTKYEKKNWSSVMLFNNEKCKALTPDYVNTATGLELHQFKWLEGDHMIGDLDPRWNLLVDYDAYDENAGNVHFTEGGPYFVEHENCDYADEWRAMRDDMLYCMQRGEKKPA